MSGVSTERKVSAAFQGLAAAGAGSAAAFGSLILALPSDPVWLHETAGVVLLSLVLAAAALAAIAGPKGRTALRRSMATLVALVAMGATGALLALGILPGSADAVPLVFLALVIVGFLSMYASTTCPPEATAVAAARS